MKEREGANGTTQLSQLRLVRLPLRGHGALHLLTSSGSCLSYLSAQICSFFNLHFKSYTPGQNGKMACKRQNKLGFFCVSKNRLGFAALNNVPCWLDPCEIFVNMTFHLTLCVERYCDIPNLQSAIAQIVMGTLRS